MWSIGHTAARGVWPELESYFREVALADIPRAYYRGLNNLNMVLGPIIL